MFEIEWGGMTPFYGQFRSYSGTLTYDGQNPESFACEIIIPVESIDTANEQRDRHLKSPDFFNARENPNITFRGTELSDDGDGAWILKGELTMNGQTRPVEAKLEKLLTRETRRGERLGLAGEMTINRSGFGMSHMIDQGLGDEVTLLFGVQSVKTD